MFEKIVSLNNASYLYRWNEFNHDVVYRISPVNSRYYLELANCDEANSVRSLVD